LKEYRVFHLPIGSATEITSRPLKRESSVFETTDNTNKCQQIGLRMATRRIDLQPTDATDANNPSTDYPAAFAFQKKLNPK
jgi:hypothetical protein